MVRWGLASAVVLLGACGDAPEGPDGGGADGGSLPDGMVEPAAPTPPTAPELPQLTPCPAGWRQVADPDDAALVTCDPWPAGGALDCADDEAHFPGGAGCERVGTACGDDDWAVDLPADREIVYVKAGAPVAGDGTRERPVATIRRALAVAPDGAVIALSKGVFDEQEELDVAAPVTLWGACVAETVIASSLESAQYATLVLAEEALGARNLTVSGARAGILVTENAAAAELEAVVVRDVPANGVTVATGGKLRATNLVVRDVRSARAPVLWTLGLEVAGSELELHRVVLERAGAEAMSVRGELSRVVGEDLAIRDTSPIEPDGARGGGLIIQDGAAVELTRAVVSGNHLFGVGVAHSGTELTATDLVIADTRSQQSDGTGGQGLSVLEGAHVSIARATLERGRGSGAEARAGAILDGADVVIRDSQAEEQSGHWGSGLVVSEEASATLRRIAIVRNRSTGLLVTLEGTAVDAEDLIVRDTRLDHQDVPDGLGGPVDCGRGIEVNREAGLSLRRALVERSDELGMVVGDVATVLLAFDLEVRDTLAVVPGGLGLVVRDAARAELERARFASNRGGFQAYDEATVTGSDVIVADGQTQPNGTGGYGFLAMSGASVELVRVLLDHNLHVGMAAIDDDTTATVEELLVTRTADLPCIWDDCASDREGGVGILALSGGAVDVRRFRSMDNDFCGVQVVGAAMDLRDGVIAGNVIGANVQAPGFDVGRLQTGVVFLDNDRSLDLQELPVPSFEMPE